MARALARRFDLPVDVVYRRLKEAHDQGHQGTELQYLCTSLGLNEALVPDLVQIMRSHEPQISRVSPRSS